MPTWQNDSLDEPLLEQAQGVWNGVNLAEPRTWRLLEDEAAGLINGDRPDAGPLRTRPGSRKIDTLAGSVQGIGFYDTPVAEKLFLAAGGIIYRGDFNEVLRLFHDEQVVRRAAYEAIVRAVHSGKLELVSQTFFNSPARFSGFEEFEQMVIGATHSEHVLEVELRERVRTVFELSQSESGASFEIPIRVDLLRTPAPTTAASPTPATSIRRA